MKRLLLVCLVLLGCTSEEWVVHQRPETLEERKAVAELEQRLVMNVPKIISGHDQDWDDVIKEAHEIAVKTVCKRRLYQYHSEFGEYHETGKMKEIQ